MRYAILGDIHSNLEALEQVLSALKRENIDKYLCVGDIVGYNADPKGCIEIVNSLCSAIAAGNHDWASVGKFEMSWFRDIAKQALLWTVPLLNDDEKKFLSALGLICEFENITLVHGTLFEAEEFHYLTGLDYLRRSFQSLNTELCFLGHTHRPVVYIMNRTGELSYSFEGRINLEPGFRYIVNVGSVGQPRDGDTRACFSIYDRENNSLEIKRLSYDFKKTQNKIIANNLPQKLALRLALGK